MTFIARLWRLLWLLPAMGSLLIFVLISLIATGPTRTARVIQAMSDGIDNYHFNTQP